MSVAAPSSRSETADAVSVILYAIASVVIVGLATWLRVLTTFREDGIAWVIPIDQQPIEATADSGARSISGFAEEVLVVSADVNAVSVASIIASIALWALAALLIIGAVILLAGNFLRGRFFVAANVRALAAVGWTLIIAPILIVMLDKMGHNGVLSAMGVEPGEPVHPLEFSTVLPVFGIGIAVGLIGVAFRSGMRIEQEKALLQKETEGLV